MKGRTQIEKWIEDYPGEALVFKEALKVLGDSAIDDAVAVSAAFQESFKDWWLKRGPEMLGQLQEVEEGRIANGHIRRKMVRHYSRRRRKCVK